MTIQNMREWSEMIIAGKERIAIPIMRFPEIDTIRKSVAGAVTTVIMDLSVEAEAFGAKVVFSEHNVPRVVDRLVSNKQEIEALEIPNLDKGRVREVIVYSRQMAEINAENPVILSCVGPFSLAGMLYGMAEIKEVLYSHPEEILLLLDKCTVFIRNYCKALKDAGANGVMLAEPAAGLLTNDLCQEFSSDFVKKIVLAVQDENFMVVFHNCGNSGGGTPAMISVGAMGYHFGNTIDMVEALDASPKDVLVMGNIDPVAIMKKSTATQVRRAVADVLIRTKDYPNYILSTGCDTPSDVPLANVIAFYQALEDYNKS